MNFSAAVRRITAHRTVTGAAALTVLLAAVTFALLASSAAAVSVTGTRRALADVTDQQTVVFVSARAATEGQATRPVTAEAHKLLAPYPVRVSHADVSLPVDVTGPHGTGKMAVVAADGLAPHVRLVSGRLPDLAAGSKDVLLPEDLARSIGAVAGSTIRSMSPFAANEQSGTYTVSGTYSSSSDDDPGFWAAVHGGAYAPVTGISTTQVAFAAPGLLATGDFLIGTSSVWAAQPDLRAATPDGLAEVESRIRNIVSGDVNRATYHGAVPAGLGLTVTSSLPREIQMIRRAETAGMSGFLIVGTLLAVLAVFALTLTLRLLREHHAEESWLARARGAGPKRMIADAGIEALLVALPTLVVVPLAVDPMARALRSLPAISALPVPQSPVRTGFIISVLIMLFCVAVQCSAAYKDARTKPTRQARSPRVAAVQRAGGDLGLAALAVSGFLQLRHYRSPVSSGFGGLAIDPVLVVTPAVTAAALAVLVLRLLPFAAGIADRRIGGSTGLPGALGGWQVSRRAVRHVGTVLLLVLALAVGAMAVTDSAMRSRSVADRAAFQVGADARVTGSTLPPEVARSAYASLPGTASVAKMTVGSVLVGSVEKTAVSFDSAAVAADLPVRSDLVPQGAEELLAPLRAQVSASASASASQDATLMSTGVELPGRPDTVTVSVKAVAPLAGQTIGVRLMDPDGTRFVPDAVLPIDDGVFHDVQIPLIPKNSGGFGLTYPLRFEGFDVTYVAPLSRGTKVSLDIKSLTVSAADGAAQIPVSIPGGLTWRQNVDSDSSLPNTDPESCDPSASGGTALQQRSAPPLLCGGAGTNGEFATVTLTTGYVAPQMAGQKFTVSALPGQAGSGTPTIPVLATDAFLARNDAEIGDVLVGKVGLYRVLLKVVGHVAAFPGFAPDMQALLVDHASLDPFHAELADPDAATRWLISLRPGSGSAAAASAAFAGRVEFGTAQFQSAVAADLQASAFGTSQSALLVLCAGAAPVFAAVGFAVSAVIALRNRRREFAVLRALGARPRQLSGALWFEQFVMAVIGVAAGVAIGALTAAGTVPLVTVDDTGNPVFPSVAVAVPWLRSAAVAGATAVAVVLIVMAAARVLSRVDLARMLRAGEDS